MAFTYTFEENFEDGTLGTFTSETDSDSKLSIVHYSDLARVPGMPAPWRGAYCAQVDIAGGSQSAYFQADSAFDTVTAGTTLYAKGMVWFGGDPIMADTNEFSILEALSGTAGNTTVEYGAAINYTTANGYRFGIYQGTASTTSFVPITLNKWHSFEVLFTQGTGSTLDAWFDGQALTQIADFAVGTGGISFGRIGVFNLDAGTTRGKVLFDGIITDEGRIGPTERRFPSTRILTGSEHLFVGQGEITGVSLLSGAGTDCTLRVFDTDNAYTTDLQNIVVDLKNTANNQVVDWTAPDRRSAIQVRRGAYVVLGGTTPRALITIKRATGYWSDAAVRRAGILRKPRIAD